MSRRKLAIVALLMPSLAGCRSYWCEPQPLSRAHLACANLVDAAKVCRAHDATDGAEQLAWLRDLAAAAARAEHRDPCRATDVHFAAALAAGDCLAAPDFSPHQREAVAEIYHASLARMLALASEHGRVVPGRGIAVQLGGSPCLVPVVLHGFAWNPADAQAFFPVGKYRAAGISHKYQCPGWGVPLLAQRTHRVDNYVEESFLPPRALFAATAVLRRDPAHNAPVVELFNPLQPRALEHWNGPQLASDISAQFAFREITEPELGSGWLGFISSGPSEVEGLFMLEPYQPGKIPVVMVHGLLSSPTSWIDLANDLRAAPGFTEHFQLWGFRYATGKPFLESAARMRRDLYRAVATVDPCGEDAALRNLVLVGHSMGGLVCKLQAASSEDRLWYAVANRPPEAIVTSEQTRQQIRELFFFEPQSNVRRVIYLATPHRGSTWAARPIGLAVGSLTRPDPARVAQHDQLVADNPDVFIPQITNRIPTSIDMLNPNNPLLPVIATLPTSPCVRFNSIYGYGCFDLEGPGDGIVSVNSTLTGPEESRLGVRATHTRVHRVTETTVEVLRILGEHYCEFQSRMSLTTPEVMDSARSEPQ